MLLTAVPAGAQQFWFGVKGGMPFTPILTAGIGDPFNAYTVYTNPYIVGATAEIRLTRGLSIGVDASSVITSKLPRNDHFKTGQRSRAQNMKLFYRDGASSCKFYSVSA